MKFLIAFMLVGLVSGCTKSPSFIVPSHDCWYSMDEHGKRELAIVYIDHDGFCYAKGSDGKPHEIPMSACKNPMCGTERGEGK